MTRGEAVSQALGWCRERRFRCSVLGAERDGEVWLVNVDARRGPRRHAELQLGFDAVTRELVAADEPESAPPPRPMTAEEASQRGVAWCRSRGYDCSVEDADLVPGQNVWRVRLAALPPRRGHVRLDLEATTREVVDARERLQER
jgi:hypothetical protein